MNVAAVDNAKSEAKHHMADKSDADKSDSIYADDIKICRIEVLRIVSGCDDDGYSRLRDLADDLAIASNCLWAWWVMHKHTPDETGMSDFEKVRKSRIEERESVRTFRQSEEYLRRKEVATSDKSGTGKGKRSGRLRGENKSPLAEFDRWEKAEIKRIRKECRIKVVKCTNEFRNEMGRRIASEFPHIHGRVIGLMYNCWFKKMDRQIDGLKDWFAVLCNRRSIPSATRMLPIPFDCANSEIVAERSEEYGIDLKVRVRYSRTGDGKSSKDTLILKHRGNAKLRNVEAILKNCYTGEFKFCGSTLVVDSVKGKWFLMLAYRVPRHEKVKQGDLSATLEAGEDVPLVMRIGGTTINAISHSADIVAVHRDLHGKLKNFRARYRYPSDSHRGRGRKKALEDRAERSLATTWNNFVKLRNEAWVNRVVAICCDRGIGELTFVKPGERNCVSRAGDVGEISDGRSWQWHQLKEKLSRKCEMAGISFHYASGDEVEVLR